MAYVNTGLPNSGQTQYFDIKYESTLSTAQGLDVARDLMNVCDDDYRLLVGWFRGATSMPGRLPVYVDKTIGGASWWGWGPVYNITLGLGESIFGVTPAIYTRYLLISEVSEIFMRQRQFLPNYWFAAGNEGNKGESLSCFLANEFLRLIGSPSMPSTASGTMAKAASWLNSSRDNFINLNDDNIDSNKSPEISCGISFLNYLCFQRGISIGDIIANGSDTFEGVFENLGLGPRSAAFPTFQSTVNSHYTQDGRLSKSPPILDNAFPAPELKQFVATPKVSWVPTGIAPIGQMFLSHSVPMDVLLTITTDRPDLLNLPSDRIVQRGSSDGAFSLSVKPQPATFINESATITVQFAGVSLQQLIQIYSPSAWMPPLRIVPQLPTDLCADAFIAGGMMSFSVENLTDFPNRAGLNIQWHANNATGTTMPDGTFVIDNLPAAGTAVEITAVATNGDGLTASGHLNFTVHSKLNQELANVECRIRHIVDLVNRFPRLPIPEIKTRRDKVLANIVTLAKELSVHASTLEKAARSLTAGKKGHKTL